MSSILGNLLHKYSHTSRIFYGLGWVLNDEGLKHVVPGYESQVRNSVEILIELLFVGNHISVSFIILCFRLTFRFIMGHHNYTI